MSEENLNSPLIEIKNLKQHFSINMGMFRSKPLKAVDGVSFTINKKETLGLVGESGCGKTTVGRTILHLYKPTAGEVWYDGRLIKTKADIKAFRKKATMVFQDPYSSLNPSQTILQAFDEPMQIHGIGKTRAERIERIAQLLETVQLPADYMNRFPHEFSGGQRQRICIARAMCVNPETLVCDEPVSALDVSIQAQILNLMKDLQQEKNLTYVFIAHDLSVVEFMSDWVAVMYLGRVVEYARASELYRRPSHPYTQALLSAVPIPDVDVKKDQIILEGDVPSPAHPPKGCRFHPRCWKCQERCKCEDPALSELKDAQGHCVACFYPD